MNKFVQLIIIALLPLGFAACQQDSGSPNTTTATSPSAESVTQTTGDKLIVTVPATLSACTPAVEVTVQWDAQSAHAENVEVWVGAESNAKLFAAAGTKGNAKTGPWATPGTRFELRDKATGKVIGETTVGGPKCQ